jgi:hypothetical protein
MRSFDRNHSSICGDREFPVRAGRRQKIARTTQDLRLCDRISGRIDDPKTAGTATRRTSANQKNETLRTLKCLACRHVL